MSPSLGRITDATVTVYDANYENVIGEGELDEAGTAQIQVTYHRLEPAIVEVTAGDNSSYFDESAGQVALAPGTQFHAITTEPSSTAVTPFTELAWQLARAHGSFPLDAERVDVLNDAVSWLINGRFWKMNRSPEILSALPSPNSQTDAQGDIYAAYLAALAMSGEDEAAPVLSVLSDLADDVPDGILNDFEGDYLYDDFALEFRDALVQWASVYGTQDAQEAIFAMPLPAQTLNYRANVPLRERILGLEHAVGIEIAYSADGNAEWALFPQGEEVSLHREGSVMGVAAGDNGQNPEAGEFIEGWSVDIATAEYDNLLGDPNNNGVRVEIPTGDASTRRWMMFVSRNGLDLDDLILIESNTSGVNKLAHVLVYDALDFMEPGVQSFFNDVHAMANSGDSLTVVKSPSLLECSTALIGTNDDNRYPKIAGLIYQNNSQDTESFEPQRMRYAEVGDQREILFADDTLFRINDDTGRVDFIQFNVLGEVTEWATNDTGMIDRYCD